jgi:hypothetical protein
MHFGVSESSRGHFRYCGSLNLNFRGIGLCRALRPNSRRQGGNEATCRYPSKHLLELVLETDENVVIPYSRQF